MRTAQIYFEKTTTFQGRNGTFKCAGVEIMQTHDGDAIIFPLTSKGVVGNCSITIERSALDEISNELCLISQSKNQ